MSTTAWFDWIEMGLKEIKGDWREDDDAVLGREKSLYQLKNKVDNNNRGQRGQSRGNRRKRKEKRSWKREKKKRWTITSMDNRGWSRGNRERNLKTAHKLLFVCVVNFLILKTIWRSTKNMNIQYRWQFCVRQHSPICENCSFSEYCRQEGVCLSFCPRCMSISRYKGEMHCTFAMDDQ